MVYGFVLVDWGILGGDGIKAEHLVSQRPLKPYGLGMPRDSNRRDLYIVQVLF